MRKLKSKPTKIPSIVPSAIASDDIATVIWNPLQIALFAIHISCANSERSIILCQGIASFRSSNRRPAAIK